MVFIISIVFLIIASFFFLRISQIEDMGQLENTPTSLPGNVVNEINNTQSDERSYFNRWAVNDTEQTVTIYLNCIPLTRKKPDKIIDNWTIRWIQDPEIYNDTAVDAYENYIKQWENERPLQHVGSWTPDSCKKTVYVQVINITPEILGSEVTVEGWRIIFVQAT